MGISLSDHLAGLFAAYGVLAACSARTRTGEGQRVDTSLLQSSTAFLAENMARHLNDGGASPTRRTRARTAQVYTVRDASGSPFVIHLSSPDKFWRVLLRAIGRTDLFADERFATRALRIANREAIQELLDASFAVGSRGEWLERLWAEDVPAAPLNTLVDPLPAAQHCRAAPLGHVTEAEPGQECMGRGSHLRQSPCSRPAHHRPAPRPPSQG
ncbi:MAG: hypothetical protein GEU81_10960, partial [Nitriliruptorales bacterium]|nr:hypothetical protein [Nitriliruptorales bacterium]